MPQETDQEAYDALLDLRRALETVASALSDANLDGLLAAEELLTRAVAVANERLAPAGPATRDAGRLRRELFHVRAALGRCRRLGSSLSEFASFSLTSQGATGGYSRRGETRGILSRRAVDARV